MHLAQLNIARLLAPIDSPQLEGFVEQLEPINAMADEAPGFVWRLQTEEGDATAIRPFEDDAMMLNLSVWEDVASLRTFVYRTAHVEIYRRRSGWFEKMAEPYQVLWWVDEGHIPTIDEAIERLQMLRTDGPTNGAFTFATAKLFEPDEARRTPSQRA